MANLAQPKVMVHYYSYHSVKEKKLITLLVTRVIVVGMNVPSVWVSLYKQFVQHDIRFVFYDLGSFFSVPCLGFGVIFRRSVC